jgi:hypothetical protein
VRISGEGRKEIADIRKDLESLRNSGLDIFTIRQRVNDDAGRFLAVLQNDVFPIGQGKKPDTAATSAPASTVPPSTTAPPTTAAPSTTAPPSTTVPPSTTTTTATP